MANSVTNSSRKKSNCVEKKKCDQEIDHHIDQTIWHRNYKLSRKIPPLGLSVLMCSKFYGIQTETIQVPAKARKPSHQHVEIMDLCAVLPLLKLGVQLCNDQDSIHCPLLLQVIHICFYFYRRIPYWFLKLLAVQLSLILSECRYPRANVIRRILLY
jgi:hypothetical protein